MPTCQAAEGQDPGGLVCWWLQSQTHPECCEARPAQLRAETQLCTGGGGKGQRVLLCLQTRSLAEPCPMSLSTQVSLLEAPNAFLASLLTLNQKSRTPILEACSGH